MGVKKILEFPVMSIILIVLVFGFVCNGYTKHASMHDNTSFVAITQVGSQQKCCNASISKYIESIKDNLWITSRKMTDILILLILGIAMTFAIGRLKFRFDFIDSYLVRYKLYERENPNLKLFNGLKLAFARGIINSKVF